MATLALAQIQQDPSIQQRVGGIQSARVSEYSKAMKNGDTFPPVVVYYDQEQDEYGGADGFHRCVAAEDAGLSEIEVEVREGTRRAALLHAVGANAAHGIRRKNADKRKAVFTLLADEEWRVWSDHEIAKQTHTTQPFVSKLRGLMKNDTLRICADGRVIDTAKIGKSRAVGLGKVWKRANEQERSQWIAEYREEIDAILSQMGH